MSVLPDMIVSSAVFSDDGVYRYRLDRRWEVFPETTYKPLMFVMLNPSTADDVVNDPTVTRCIRYAEAWGYEGLIVCNLFGLRTTRPTHLYNAPDPVGAENDRVIAAAAREAGLIVCAWGEHGKFMERDIAVKYLLRVNNSGNLYCLARNMSGQPKHPLYCLGSLDPMVLP